MTALIATCHKTVSPTTHVRRERMDRRASVVSGQARPTTAKVRRDISNYISWYCMYKLYVVACYKLSSSTRLGATCTVTCTAIVVLFLFRLFGIGIVLYRVQRSPLAMACYTYHSCSHYVSGYFPGWLYHIYLYEGNYM